jgi:hypothetical protein
MHGVVSVCAITVPALCLIYLQVNLFAWCSRPDQWYPCLFFIQIGWHSENGDIMSIVRMNTSNSSRLCESVLGKNHATCFKAVSISKCHLEWFNGMPKNHRTPSLREEEGNIFFGILVITTRIWWHKNTAWFFASVKSLKSCIGITLAQCLVIQTSRTIFLDIPFVVFILRHTDR